MRMTKVTTLRLSDEVYDALHARAEHVATLTGTKTPVAAVIRQAIRDYLHNPKG